MGQIYRSLKQFDKNELIWIEISYCPHKLPILLFYIMKETDVVFLISYTFLYAFGCLLYIYLSWFMKVFL